MVENGILYDVVVIKRQAGGEVRRLLSGPFDEIDARYHAKRYKTALNDDGRPLSPEQDYIVVLHHLCRMCELCSNHALAETFEERQAIEAEQQNVAHTCSHYYNTAEPV